MPNKRLIILLTLAIWLANYLVCFCGCEDDLEKPVKPEIAYFSDNHTDAESEPTSENCHSCGYCCGYQVFLIKLNQTLLADKSPTSVKNNLSPFFSEQLYFTSIFHPPKT